MGSGVFAGDEVEVDVRLDQPDDDVGEIVEVHWKVEPAGLCLVRETAFDRGDEARLEVCLVTSHGYGFSLLTFEPAQVRQLSAFRTKGSTINDVLLGGLAIAVSRWNQQHGASGGAIYLMMPINLRPTEWRLDVVGNFASYVSVRVGSSDLTTLEDAIRAAVASTRRIKDGAIAGLIDDLFGAPTILPTAVKRRLQDLIPLTGNVVVDTAVLSNLGRIASIPHLGDAGPVRELWFSPPGRMPLGASLGVATVNGKMFMTLRYRHALFHAAAAMDFLTGFKRALLTQSSRV